MSVIVSTYFSSHASWWTTTSKPTLPELPWDDHCQVRLLLENVVRETVWKTSGSPAKSMKTHLTYLTCKSNLCFNKIENNCVICIDIIIYLISITSSSLLQDLYLLSFIFSTCECPHLSFIMFHCMLMSTPMIFLHVYIFRPFTFIWWDCN